jgi:hypothetical protein
MVFFLKTAGKRIDRMVDDQIEQKRRKTLKGIIPKRIFSRLAERYEKVKKWRKLAKKLKGE